MSSESVCQVARSWLDVGSFHTHLMVRFMIFTSVRNILNTPLYFTLHHIHSMYSRPSIVQIAWLHAQNSCPQLLLILYMMHEPGTCPKAYTVSNPKHSSTKAYMYIFMSIQSSLVSTLKLR
jgi:hypothetical protein